MAVGSGVLTQAKLGRSSVSGRRDLIAIRIATSPIYPFIMVSPRLRHLAVKAERPAVFWCPSFRRLRQSLPGAQIGQEAQVHRLRP